MTKSILVVDDVVAAVLAKRDAHVSIILMSGYEGKYIPIAEELSSAKGLDIIGTLQKPFS